MGFLRNLFVPVNTNPDDVRMTLGEHLEELRSRLIRALVGLAIGATVCYYFIDKILAFLLWPVYVVYKAHGYDTVVHTLGPSEGFMVSLKVAIIVGLLISAPYSIMQIWGFIAAGLYQKERKWVRSFAPTSIALFFAGAIFLIVVVNPLLLDFLLTYQTELPDMSGYMPTALVSSGSTAIKTHAATQPAEAELKGTPMPAFEHDPGGEIPEGIPWVNLTEHEIRLRLGDHIYKESHLDQVGAANRIQPDLRLEEIIPFTLGLAAAFGIGFQVPVAVAFIAAIGLFQARQMAQYRRHVIFVMAIAAAIITPSPDPFSMSLLLLPMIGLFEAGLFAARRIERTRAADAAG